MKDPIRARSVAFVDEEGEGGAPPPPKQREIEMVKREKWKCKEGKAVRGPIYTPVKFQRNH